jgi:anti-sigma B factor antagonist
VAADLELERRLTQLRARFVVGLDGRRAELRTAWSICTASRACADSQERATLSSALHRLAGAAGAYSFNMLSKRAHALEKLVRSNSCELSTLNMEFTQLIECLSALILSNKVTLPSHCYYRGGVQSRLRNPSSKEKNMELIATPDASDVMLIRLNEAHLDAGNVKEFREIIGPLLDQHARVVFDMSQLRFVDSSGLGSLISCLRQTQERRGDFKLCAMSQPVCALFELMRMHRVFSIHETCEEAKRAFS